jgi:uncharacterized cupredoxin-like copper-binding protein
MALPRLPRIALAAALLLGPVLAGCGKDTPTRDTTVVGTEMAFSPANLSLTEGTWRFHFQNKGAVAHELALEQPLGQPIKRVMVGPRAEGVLEVDLKAGTYEMTCREPGHFEQGMKGTVTVTKDES